MEVAMRGHMRRFAETTTRLAAIGAFGLMAFGCSEEPVSPRSAAPSATPQFVSAPPTQPVAERAGYTEARIGPDGGTLSLENIELVIPAGALASKTKVFLLAAGRGVVQVTIGPSGVNLRQPATLRITNLRARTDYLRYSQIAIVQVARSGRWTRLASIAAGEQIEATTTTVGDFTLARGDTPDGGILEPVRYLTGRGYLTQFVTAAEGGVVQYGIYRLTFPAQALAADTYITIEDPGNGYAMCELSPHGIQFAAPVLFEIDLTRVDIDRYADLGIYWYDESSDIWVDQGATRDDDRVWIGLNHFSQYVLAGRAGW
jgi:hypothetical protein